MQGPQAELHFTPPTVFRQLPSGECSQPRNRVSRPSRIGSPSASASPDRSIWATRSFAVTDSANQFRLETPDPTYNKNISWPPLHKKNRTYISRSCVIQPPKPSLPSGRWSELGGGQERLRLWRPGWKTGLEGPPAGALITTTSPV